MTVEEARQLNYGDTLELNPEECQGFSEKLLDCSFKFIRLDKSVVFPPFLIQCKIIDEIPRKQKMWKWCPRRLKLYNKAINNISENYVI